MARRTYGPDVAGPTVSAVISPVRPRPSPSLQTGDGAADSDDRVTGPGSPRRSSPSATEPRTPVPAPTPRTRTRPRVAARALCALLALLACLALAGGAVAAEQSTPVPANVVQPLGAVDPPAVVPYKQLVGAADARNLNAAVVDTSSYWVAATDRNGHVIAAQIPRPKAG